MAFDGNFVEVPVSKSEIVDPRLKIRLATGRWNPESSAKAGAFDIILFHDPEIRPDCLTMPPPEKVVRNREILGAPPLDAVVFESAQCREIAKMVLDVDQIGNEVALIYRGGQEPTFRYVARLIETAAAGPISEHSWLTIRLLLESVPLIPLWRKDYAEKWGSNRISVYIARGAAEELVQFANLPPVSGDGELVRIASVEVAA